MEPHAACQLCHGVEQLGGYRHCLRAPSPEALCYCCLPFGWHRINLFWLCDSSDDYTVFRRSQVTCCYMLGLSLTVPLEPDQTLSGEINSSGDRDEWLNSWPACEDFVQFKDRTRWQGDFMLQGDTIDTRNARRQRDQKEETSTHILDGWRQQSNGRWQRR